MRKVVVGGHWNPFHVGHLQLIQDAKKLGDYLIVVVANDIQAKNKRPDIFMPLHDRMMLMQNIKEVDQVVASIDTDTTIKNTLKMIRPDIVASGCDETHPDAVAEKAICDQMGIQTVYNVGGDKIRNSSEILSNYKNENK